MPGKRRKADGSVEPMKKKTHLTIAQAATYSVCEAFLRFSSQVSNVTANIVKRKPSATTPTIKAEDLPDDARSVISDF